MGKHVSEPTQTPADFLWWKAQRKAAREAFRDIEYELTTAAQPARGSVFSAFHRASRTPNVPRTVKRPASLNASPASWRANHFPKRTPKLPALRKRPDPDVPNVLVTVGMFVLLLLALVGWPS